MSKQGLGYENPNFSKKKKKDEEKYEFYGSVDDRGRRTWDKDAYVNKAKYGHAGVEAATHALELSDKRNLPPSQRDLLQAREYKVDLDSRLNRTSVVSASDGGKDGSGGYYCEVCDCVIKDSMNFLDHINGKKHIQNLGMSMKLKRSTVEDVKDRFKFLKEKKNEQKKEYSLTERLADAKEEEEKMVAYNSQVRKDRKERKRKKDDDSRKKDLDLKRAKRAMEEKLRREHDALIRENERKAAAEKKKSKNDSDDSDEHEPDDIPPPPPPKAASQDLLAATENDDDMMAMMGFGGFGGSAKE